MTRILYYSDRSPYARKVRIVLAEKNLPCQLQTVNLAEKSPEFLRLSPIGKIPVFVDEDGTSVWDSTLIVEYLDEVYPNPNFYDHDRSAKIQCQQWEELADSLADNAVRLWIENSKGDLGRQGDRLKFQATIDRLLQLFEESLVNLPYLMGEQWTIVDIAAVSSLGYYSLRISQDWHQTYPNLSKWFHRLHERSSVQATVPKP